MRLGIVHLPAANEPETCTRQQILEVRWRSPHQFRRPEQHDSTIVNATLAAVLPSPIFVAPYGGPRPGLPGLSGLWGNLRIRLHKHEIGRPAVGHRGCGRRIFKPHALPFYTPNAQIASVI